MNKVASSSSALKKDTHEGSSVLSRLEDDMTSRNSLHETVTASLVSPTLLFLHCLSCIRKSELLSSTSEYVSMHRQCTDLHHDSYGNQEQASRERERGSRRYDRHAVQQCSHSCRKNYGFKFPRKQGKRR